MERVRKSMYVVAVIAVCVFLPASYASAHVTVKPSEAASASYQLFTVSVPNEKPLSTVAVKVLIPENVSGVTPTNKAGWSVSTEKNGDTVTTISWSDGEIKDGLRDEFTFSAKTPDSPGELQWKAYQTYADGTVVAWDQTESDSHGHSHGETEAGPLSVTMVTETAENAADEKQEMAGSVENAQTTANRGMYLGIAGVLAGLVAVFFATRKK